MIVNTNDGWRSVDFKTGRVCVAKLSQMKSTRSIIFVSSVLSDFDINTLSAEEF